MCTVFDSLSEINPTIYMVERAIAQLYNTSRNQEWSFLMKSSLMLKAVTASVVDTVVGTFPGIVDKIILYGSYARGDFSPESDIDMMILMNCDRDEIIKYRAQVSKIASRIGLNNDVEVSLLLRDKETFEKSLDILPFYQNVQREGVALYEQTI